MKKILKKTALLVAALAVCVSAFAIDRAEYISPNNDGVMDELVIPLSISERRYISEWALVITDDAGTVVRTIGNKEKRPEEMTVKLFFKQLFAKKEGVAVPESVMWNGIMDSGEVAPDGLYHYYVTATDDNGNVGKTRVFDITVDNTEPEINLAKVSESSKIFGAGNKTHFVIDQTGSAEDLWLATITDVAGNVVRTWKFENSAPQKIGWDGKNDLGVAVDEGVYTYRITSTDRAGNVSEPAIIQNIIYDAVPRSINLSIKDSPFSPNADGIRDTLSIVPYMSNSSGLLSWDIAALNKDGGTVRTWSGTSEAPEAFDYDGTDGAGKVLSDGDYQLKFSAKYNNGQESVITRMFSVDVTAPTAVVRFDLDVFSPDGDGRQDTITFTQETSKEKKWQAEILAEDGAVVKKFDFGEIPPAKVTWDGITDSGVIVEGNYRYRLYSTDLAGNTGSGETKGFELNTGVTEVLLTMSDRAFSPNRDRSKDTITFTPQVKTTSSIVEYSFAVQNESGVTVYEAKANRALPKNFTWNGATSTGTPAPDGLYSARLFTRSENGSENTVSTAAFMLDTVYPSLEMSAPYVVISPNGDGRKDTLPLTVTSSEESLWTAEIKDSQGETVRSYAWMGTVPSFEWDGVDEAGNVVPDGAYTITLASADEAGNAVKVSLPKPVTVDTRAVKAYVTAEYEGFAPCEGGLNQTQEFSITAVPADGISSWSFTIATADGTPVQGWSSADQANLPSQISWNGAGKDDLITEGMLSGTLSIEYEKGDVVTVSTSQFLCSVTKPQLSVRTAPRYFSPDNDGVDDDLFIALGGKDVAAFTNWSFTINDPQNGKPFWRTSGKSTITERIIWDGRGNNGELVQSATDYPYVFTVTNELGLSETVRGSISVDVLVIRVGDVLKMQIPSIIFRSDSADFAGKGEDPKNGLEQSVIDNNERVLRRVAEILNKFKDYKVTIEGHANNISGTEVEETEDTAMYGLALVPLSEKRAEFVKDKLVGYGIDRGRLSTKGMGGRQPVAAREDRDNWWKNRRVEFILNK